MSQSLRSLAAGLLVGASLAPFAVAQAQETDGAEEPKKFDTIVVTAQRREQNLQDVPLSVTAVSGEALENLGVADLTEVSKLSPNVTLEVSRGTNTTLTAFIRGVGQQDPVAGFESGVGIYIDDVYLNRPQGAVLDVFDVERVEVLRGPQGTLYGRNTIGGAVKYVTRGLSDEPSLELKGAIGNYNQREAIVKASTPMGDKARIGLNLATLKRDGFGDNLLTGEENYDKDVFAGRFAFELDATDDFSLDFSADYVKDKSNARQGHRLIAGQLSGAGVLDNVFDTRAGLNVVDQDVEGGGASLTAEWALNDAITLKNVVAYREDKSTTPIDFDSLPSGDLDVPAIYENDQLSEEFQILFSSDRLNGVAGFYYLDANASTVFDVLLANTGDLIGLPGLNAQTFGEVGTKTWSVFGDFTFDVTDKLGITVGGRYTADERSSTVQRRTYIGGFSEFFGGNGVVIATTSDFEGTNDWNRFTPRVSVSYQPVEEHNVYATYSQGFKGGGFDPRGQTTGAPDLDQDGTVTDAEIFDFMAFDPEEVTSYEIGLKSVWGGGRVNTSFAAFYMDYSDVQVPGSIGLDTDDDGVNDTFTGVTTNAGEATVQGVELEALATVAEDMFAEGDAFNTTVSLGYIDASYDEWLFFGEDVANERVFQNTPDWTASGVFSYSRPVSSGFVNASATVSYKGDTSQFEQPNPFLDQPAYTLVDASVVWTSDEGGWTVGMHGKNLTDEEYIVAGYNFVAIGNDGSVTPSLGVEGTLTGFYGNPRTFTVSVGKKF